MKAIKLFLAIGVLASVVYAQKVSRPSSGPKRPDAIGNCCNFSFDCSDGQACVSGTCVGPPFVPPSPNACIDLLN
ncbi:MAG TPA: hypothetical protein VKZ53_25950 [Candidatus Angelobacter sp.]|nr:hypothetical protein [Candidatus Angelobacter sp.]